MCVPRFCYVQINNVTIMTAQNLTGYSSIVAAVVIHVAGNPCVVRAVNIAKKIQSKVTLVYALGDTQPLQAAAAIQDDETKEVTKELMAQLQLSYPDVNQIKLLTGRRWSAIVDVADEMVSDLIVIGSCVHGQLLSLLGETSDRVLHHTQRDVLVVHSGVYDEDHPPCDYKRIVTTTDLSGRGYGAVQRAAALADNYGAELTLLNVLEHFPTDRENERITPENQDPMEYQINLRRRDLQGIAESLGLPNMSLDVIATSASVKQSIPEYAQEKSADLIVVGARDQYGLGVLLGNTADGIIHHTPCDVLVVHETANV